MRGRTFSVFLAGTIFLTSAAKSWAQPAIPATPGIGASASVIERFMLRHPLGAAGAAGVVGGFAERHPFITAGGVLLGGVLLSEAYKNSRQGQQQRQAEYIKAKHFCDEEQPPETGNECGDLSRAIDHAEECISFYTQWDNKWQNGRHDEKISGWSNRVSNLKAEHNQKCTGSK
jgi:hypothetical protein